MNLKMEQSRQFDQTKRAASTMSSSYDGTRTHLLDRVMHVGTMDPSGGKFQNRFRNTYVSGDYDKMRFIDVHSTQCTLCFAVVLEGIVEHL